MPLFTLGIPASPTIAVLLGAFMMNGLTPGPFLFKEKPDFVWGVIASLYVGNLILVVLNLPLVGLFVSLLRVPYHILVPLIVLFCSIGAFSSAKTSFTSNDPRVGLSALVKVSPCCSIGSGVKLLISLRYSAPKA